MIYRRFFHRQRWYYDLMPWITCIDGINIMNIYNLLCKDTVTRDSKAHMTSQKCINCSVRCRFDFGPVEFFFYIIKTFRFHFSFEQPLNKCELTRGFCPQEHMGDDTINLKIKGGTCKYPSLQFLIPMAYRLRVAIIIHQNSFLQW